MTRAIASAFVLTLIAACLWRARAADEASTKFRVNVNLVQVRVAVTDETGHYVRDLTLNDFRVLENGVEQKISTITLPARRETAAAATSVFVLFDTSNRMYDGFVYAEDAIADFIRQLPASNSVAVYGFSRNVTRLARLTEDRFAAIAGLRRAVSGDDTSLYDSILVTLREASRVSGNRVLVVFSNGPDTASILAPEQVRTVAEDEGIPIYVISTKELNRASNKAFHELTSNTGGQTYFASNWQSQKQALGAIGDDLNNSYVLGYYPQGTDAASYRKIDVEVTSVGGAKYRIRTRSGYEPEPAKTNRRADATGQ